MTGRIGIASRKVGWHITFSEEVAEEGVGELQAVGWLRNGDDRYLMAVSFSLNNHHIWAVLSALLFIHRSKDSGLNITNY